LNNGIFDALETLNVTLEEKKSFLIP